MRGVGGKAAVRMPLCAGELLPWQRGAERGFCGGVERDHCLALIQGLCTVKWFSGAMTRDSLPSAFLLLPAFVYNRE